MRNQQQVFFLGFFITILVLSYYSFNPAKHLSIYDKIPVANDQPTLIVDPNTKTKSISTPSLPSNATHQTPPLPDAGVERSNKLLDDVTINFSNISQVVSSVIIRKEYSANSCWLEPRWGTRQSKITNGDGDGVVEEECLGQPQFNNTNATFLTCPSVDKPTLGPSLQQNRHPGLTVALLYFAKPAALVRQLENFASYPEDIRKHLTLLIIDDGSPEGLRATDYIDWSKYDSQFRIRLARITTDKQWNIGGARNLAFYLADTKTALLLDLDVMVPMETMKTAMTWKTRNETHILAHRFNRKRPDGREQKHPAICVIDVNAYWENGGCDEDFCGNYGYTDVHFWFRWRKDKNRVKIDHLDTFIIEFEQKACDETLIGTNEQDLKKCQNARKQVKKGGKELKANHAVYKLKTLEGCWSNKYLRFGWILEK